MLQPTAELRPTVLILSGFIGTVWVTCQNSNLNCVYISVDFDNFDMNQ